MFERAIGFAVRQRGFIIVMVLALAVAGVRAFLNLPIEAFPDVQDTQVVVVTQYPGQAPEEVERVVTLPIERELSGTAQMTQLRSVSITGLSVVTATFADGTEDRFARSQVFEKLQSVNLPPGVQASLAPLTTAVGEVYRYIVEAPSSMPVSEVRALQDWVIRPAIRQAAGVADVVSIGGTVKAYQIEVDPLALRRYGITLAQVSDAVAANNSNAGGGILQRGGEGLVLRSVGVYKSLDDLRAVAITADAGRPVTLADVARVSVGERPKSGIVSYNGEDSVVEGIVQMLKGGNAAKVIEGVQERVDRLNDGHHLPAGVKVHTVYQRTDLIDHTVETVGENLLVGALLVVSVLVIFLRSWSASLIVAAVIPLTLLFAFILIDARGVSANLISLGAVDFGILIDSAVVMVEALMVRLALHPPLDPHPGVVLAHRLSALRSTVGGLSRPILFSKAIIVLAFVPIFTFQRVEGKIFSPVAFTLSFALLGALLLTLTLVPALLSWRLEKGSLEEVHLGWMEWLQTRYRQALEWSLDNTRKVVTGAAAALALVLALVPAIGTEFLPRLDEGNIWLTISLPPASALAQSKDIERAVRSRLLAMPEVKQVIAHVGRPDDGTDPKGPNNVEILADLKPRGEWRFDTKEGLVEAMSAKLREIPGLPTNFSQVIQDNVEESLSGVKGEIAVKIYGPDLEILEEKAEQVVAVLNGIRGSTDVAAVKVSGQAELTIVPDRRKLARYGIAMQDISQAVQVALGGYPATAFYEGDRRFDIVVRLQAEARTSLSDIGNLQIDLPGGKGTVPLAELAEIGIHEGASRISREAGGRNVSVKANLTGRDQGSFVAEAQQKVAEKVHLPPGYTLTWGGQFENQQRAMKRLSVIVPVSLLAIFALLFWNFGTMPLASIVLVSAPLTLIGGFAGLWLAGLHLSVSAAVGFIAVSGISVQNGVIMAEEMVNLLNNGAEFRDAVLDGAVRRLRPILMTALMAGLGLLPAALSHGIGSETQRPFAVVIVGGVLSATLIGLVLIPTLMARFWATPER